MTLMGCTCWQLDLATIIDALVVESRYRGDPGGKPSVLRSVIVPLRLRFGSRFRAVYGATTESGVASRFVGASDCLH